jgi:hypothetical protein
MEVQKMFRKQSRIALIVLAVLCVAVPALSAEQNEQILNIVPADVLFCARVKNLEYTANMIDQFLVGISPVPLGTSILVRTQLARILGTADPAGVNVAGSFAIFTTAEPNQTIPDIYVLIPVTDYSRITDVNTNVPKPDVNGISTIMLDGKPFSCITKVSSYALLARDYTKTLRMARLLSAADTPTLFAALGPDEVKQADSDLIWAYGNIAKTSKIYGQTLFQKIEQLKIIMQKSADPNKPKSPMKPAFMIEAYAHLLKILLDEGQSLTIATSPKPDLLLVKTLFKARSGTETAGILTGDSETQRKNNLGGYLDDGAVMNSVAWINHGSMKKLSYKTIDWMSQSAGRDPNADDVVKFKKISAELVDSLGDLCICSFSVDTNNKPPFDGEYFLMVKDADRFNRATDEFVHAWAGSVFDDFYKKMGAKTAFTIKRGVDNYKGISIDASTFDMKWGDGNSPEFKMLNNMYGRGISYRCAIVNGLWISKISSDPNALYKVIDQVKAGPSLVMCSEMQKAFALIPDANSKDFFATYNYLRLFKMMKAAMPDQMPAVDIPTKSNLVFAVIMRNGTVSVDIAIPKEHLSEIMTMFQMAMQQQMQQQKQPTTTSPPSPNSP